ncbi:MAG: type II secretion system protein GspJ [Candidatus Omnitrophota bacterium]|nr:type II secretion system protein GspJ [Candidatus Omnitrophota bacterium]
MNFRKGFTLLELLISVAIISLAGVTIYSVFANGITTWRIGSKNKSFERNIRLTSEKIVREIRNTFEFSTIPFEGTEDSVKFPALIPAKADPVDEKDGEESRDYYELGRVAYFYDKKEETLCKEQKSYAGVFKQEEITQGRVLIPQVSQLELSYCYLDNATGTYKWKDDWKKEDQDSLPQAVKIKLSFKKKTNREDFERTIFIPTGTGEQKIELGTTTKEIGAKELSIKEITGEE